MTSQEFLTTWSRRWRWDDLVDDVRHEKIYLPDEVIRGEVRLLPVVRIIWQPLGLMMSVDVCLGLSADELTGGFRFNGAEYDEFRFKHWIDMPGEPFKSRSCRELGRGLPMLSIRHRSYASGPVFFGKIKPGVYNTNDCYELQMDVETVCYRMATYDPWSELEQKAST